MTASDSFFDRGFTGEAILIDKTKKNYNSQNKFHQKSRLKSIFFGQSFLYLYFFLLINSNKGKYKYKRGFDNLRI